MQRTSSRRMACGVAVVAFSLATSPVGAQDLRARVARVLKATPLIDGHNDWPEVLREREGDARWTVDLRSRLGTGDAPLQHRHRPAAAGHGRRSILVRVGVAQSAGARTGQADARADRARPVVRGALSRNVCDGPHGADVRRIHKSGRIASLIGVEGGGQIDGSFGVLRAYRALGASYLTLTHSRNLEWADSATDDPKHDGLTEFGESVVRRAQPPRHAGRSEPRERGDDARCAARVESAGHVFSFERARAR